MKEVKPIDGKWQLRGEFFHTGKHLDHWGLIDLANIDDNAFVNALSTEGNLRGLKIEKPAMVKKFANKNLDKDFNYFCHDLMKSGKSDMIIVIFPYKDSNLYSIVKALGDTVYKIPTQIVLKKNAMIGPKSSQTIHNICLKINAKLGGVNQTLHASSIPECLTKPVIANLLFETRTLTCV